MARSDYTQLSVPFFREAFGKKETKGEILEGVWALSRCMQSRGRTIDNHNEGEEEWDKTIKLKHWGVAHKHDSCQAT